MSFSHTFQTTEKRKTCCNLLLWIPQLIYLSYWMIVAKLHENWVTCLKSTWVTNTLQTRSATKNISCFGKHLPSFAFTCKKNCLKTNAGYLKTKSKKEKLKTWKTVKVYNIIINIRNVIFFPIGLPSNIEKGHQELLIFTRK